MSFRRFVGLRARRTSPDETTIVKFRQRLREANLDATLFDIVRRSIDKRGLLLKEGTLVDALIIEAPTGRKTGEKDEAGGSLTTRDPGGVVHAEARAALSRLQGAHRRRPERRCQRALSFPRPAITTAVHRRF